MTTVLLYIKIYIKTQKNVLYFMFTHMEHALRCEATYIKLFETK